MRGKKVGGAPAERRARSWMATVKRSGRTHGHTDLGIEAFKVRVIEEMQVNPPRLDVLEGQALVGPEEARGVPLDRLIFVPEPLSRSSLERGGAVSGARRVSASSCSELLLRGDRACAGVTIERQRQTDVGAVICVPAVHPAHSCSERASPQHLHNSSSHGFLAFGSVRGQVHGTLKEGVGSVRVQKRQLSFHRHEC